MAFKTIGDIAIDRVNESEGPAFAPTTLIPEATAENLAPHLEWLAPRCLDPTTGKLVIAVQSYVVRTDHHTILIDTCVGNDKARSFAPEWNMLSSAKYLTDLAALGIAPEDVDFVMCTHLHPDHVGWNTRLINGRWVPTFANARYVINREEWLFWGQKNRRKPNYSDGCIDDSVLPVIAAGQAMMVENDHAIDDQIRIEPSPGHTPGHVSVRLASRGREAVMIGDMMHSPVQCAHPEWGVECHRLLRAGPLAPDAARFPGAPRGHRHPGDDGPFSVALDRPCAASWRCLPVSLRRRPIATAGPDRRLAPCNRARPGSESPDRWERCHGRGLGGSMHIAAFDLSILGANGIVGAGMGIAIAEAIRSVCYRDDSAPAAAAE